MHLILSQILGRGYNKFFNINERPETKLDALPDIIKFPLYGYKIRSFINIEKFIITST
jgi:tRNA splicing ligase